MTDSIYAPGEARALVTAKGAALVGADLSAELLTRLWQQLEEGRGLAAVLEALTGAFGTSLTAIPAFAVSLREGGALRLAVRGRMEIDVETAAGTEHVSGTGVTTWSERLVEGATSATLRVTGATDAAKLPIRDGVVHAGILVLTLGPDAEPAPEPRLPEPAQVPEPRLPEPAQVPEVVEELAPPVSEPAGEDVAPSETLLPDESTLTVTQDPDPVTPDTPADGTTTGYDHLWGETVARSVEDAAVRVSEQDGDGDDPVVLGDHDGATISVEQLRAVRESPAPIDSSVPPLAPPRPQAIGRLRLSNGQVVLLDRTVVIGRRPRSTRVTGTDLPHLVAVDSPEQDISRSHVEVRAEGDSILVTDLNTTNGTILRRTGAEPVRLHPDERTVVVPGDIIDLGDGITVVVEEMP